jgi:hypothetical protein
MVIHSKCVLVTNLGSVTPACPHPTTNNVKICERRAHSADPCRLPQALHTCNPWRAASTLLPCLAFGLLLLLCFRLRAKTP